MNIPVGAYWNLLVSYLRPQWTRVVLLTVMLLSSIGLQLLNPQLLRSFIDAATAGTVQDDLTRTALLFIGVALVTQGLSIGVTYLSQNVGWTATNNLRADVAAHCLRLDLSFHKARTPGELIERVDGDVTAFANFFSQFVVQMLGNAVLMLGALVFLFLEDWRVGVGLSLFVLLAVVLLARMRSVAVPFFAAQREAAANFFGFLGERLAGTEDIRANGGVGWVMRHFYQHLQGWLRISQRAALFGTSLWIASVGVFALGNAMAFGVGAYLFGLGAISIGTVYMIFYYTELLRRPIEQIRTQLQDLQRAGASIARVTELMNTSSRLVDGARVSMPEGALSVELDRVHFGYDDRERVLEDVTLMLEPGKVLGLLGRTGSGKTTLARLLLRLYDPQQGEIRLGGTPLPAMRLHALRQRVGMVTQDVQLFNATIRDNLTFFDRSIPDERILETLDDLGLLPWLRALPAGLDSVLEADGEGLSAGEAQLLAFTRVFLKDPGLVILDEASSRLDPATEQLIERAIDKLLHGRTGIIIAHRLGTLRRADEILILDEGRVREYGLRNELLANSTSRFSQLMRTGMEEVLA